MNTTKITLLRLIDLPVFSSINELASLIHVDASFIEAIDASPRRFYKRYKIPKANHSLRLIKQPAKNVKAIQAWILRNILDKITPSPFATAYIKGKGLLEHVSPHSNNRYFLCVDLEDFFPSISSRRVEKLFSRIGYSAIMSKVLSNLCTCDCNLPQGAVTSPSLSNIISSKLDRRIAGYTSRRNITYTRYADDITLSSNNRTELSKSLSIVIKIIKSEHFKPNVEKIRFSGPRRRCIITGLVKNSSEARFGIGKKNKRKMRAVMHNIVFCLNKKEAKYTTEESINGWLSYLNDVDKTSCTQMSKYWGRLRQKKRELGN